MFIEPSVTLRNPPFKIGQRNGTKDSVNDLWSITLELAKSTKLNCWVKTAALVFTSFWRDIGLLDDVTWHHLAQLYDTLRKKKHIKKPWCDGLGSIQDMDRNESKWIDMDRNGTLNSKSLDLNRFDIMRWSSHGDTNPTSYHWLVVSSMLMISLNFLAYLDGQRLRQGDGICFAPSLRPLGIPRISDSSWNAVQKIQFPCFRCFSVAMLSMAISGTKLGGACHIFTQFSHTHIYI